jgi:hypothetical protein
MHLPSSRSTRRPPLQLELLEERDVPAIFTVNNVSNTGLGSLRQAILDANAAPGNDVITFASGVSGTISLATELPHLSSNVELRGPGAKTVTVRRSATAGTPNFSIFSVDGGAVVTLSGLTISFGKAAVGAGVRNLGTLTLADSHITSNAATQRGGGIASDGVLAVLNSTVSANTSAGTGAGGIDVGLGDASLTNLTVSGNQSTGGAGGLAVAAGATAGLQNVTVAANTSGGTTAGGVTSAGTVALANTLLANNTGGSGADVQGNFASLGFNLIGKKGTTAVGFLASDKVGTPAAPLDPRLGPLQNNGGPTPTHALLANSPAADAGSNSDLPSTDQRGMHRQVNGTADIGAIEMQTGSAVVTTLQLTASPADPAPGQPFTVTARVVNVVTGATLAVATGSVNFSVDGGTPTTVTLVNGEAVFTLPAGLPLGWHYVVASYSGDSNHLISSSAPMLLGVGIPKDWSTSWTSTVTTVTGPLIPAGTNVSPQLSVDGFRSTLPVWRGFRRGKGGRFFRRFTLRNLGPGLGAVRMLLRRLPRGFRLVSSDVVVENLASDQVVTFTIEIRATPAALRAGRTPTFTPLFLAA